MNKNRKLEIHSYRYLKHREVCEVQAKSGYCQNIYYGNFFQLLPKNKETKCLYHFYILLYVILWIKKWYIIFVNHSNHRGHLQSPFKFEMLTSTNTCKLRAKKQQQQQQQQQNKTKQNKKKKKMIIVLFKPKKLKRGNQSFSPFSTTHGGKFFFQTFWFLGSSYFFSPSIAFFV